jgi:Fe-S oxidoreductase
MATYKAEFFYHYHQHRRRPLNNYLFGYINEVARWGMFWPALFNFAARNGFLSRLGKAAMGINQRRELPTLAKQSFTDWFRKRPARKNGGPEVVLWPDTFNNYFTPDVGKAAVEVLEAAGYRVRLPDGIVCCGRPLYEFGFLETAKQRLERILQVLDRPLQEGAPLIGLEPACTSVFRDELCELFPDDPRAKRLRLNTFLLSEFLHHHAKHFEVPTLKRQALVHLHCNHKAVFDTASDEALIKAMELDGAILDDGCCGMAGSFGYHKDKYDVSIKAGERVLLPAVRRSDSDTLIIADGYSCREQIRQETRRQAIHTAQVIQMALTR